jgi:beta-glucanase (GH16 family)
MQAAALQGTRRRPLGLLAVAVVLVLGLVVLLDHRGGSDVPGPLGPPGRWTSTFADDFDGSSLDGQLWRANRSGDDQVDGPFNPDLEGAAFSPANVAVRDGNLILSLASGSTDVDGRTYPFTSGTVSTQGHATLRDGDYVEARVWVPSGAGLWPAFWACTASTWPPEIDGFEFFNAAEQSQPSFNYIAADGTRSGPSTFGVEGQDYRGGWHTYGWLRHLGVIIPYLDGVPYPEAGTRSADGADYFIIFNLSVYRDADVQVVPGQSELRVDWVRAWRQDATSAEETGS